MARPLQSWRNKSIDVAAWPTNNGGCSFTIRKTWKPKDATEYKETKTFFPNDVKVLIDLLAQASAWAHEYFAEPIVEVDTRPVNPAVAAVVKSIIEDDIPF